MTTNTEDRLTAALQARADLVQPEDLRPDAPPATVVPLVRRPAAWAVVAAAAAAVAAVLVVPSVLGGDDGQLQPMPAPTSPVVPNGDEVPGGDWQVAYTYPRAYDVDGDGVADPVVIRTKGAGELPPGARRLEAHLSTGGVAAALLDYDSFDLTAIDPVQVDTDASDEILYFRGTVDDGQELGVLDLVDGALVDLDVPADPGLTSSPDADFRSRGWFVDDDAGLFSYRTVEGGFVPGGANPTQPPYEVDLFHWVLSEGDLTAERVGTRCWDGGAGASSIRPC